MKLKHVSSVCKKQFYCFLTSKIQFYSKEHKDFPADETQTSTSETPLTVRRSYVCRRRWAACGRNLSRSPHSAVPSCCSRTSGIRHCCGRSFPAL